MSRCGDNEKEQLEEEVEELYSPVMFAERCWSFFEFGLQVAHLC